MYEISIDTDVSSLTNSSIYKVELFKWELRLVAENYTITSYYKTLIREHNKTQVVFSSLESSSIATDQSPYGDGLALLAKRIDDIVIRADFEYNNLVLGFESGTEIIISGDCVDYECYIVASEKLYLIV